LHIVARTRFVSEFEPLKSLGAKEVVPEEFETSVEIFNRVLSAYLIPRRDIDRFTAEVRAEGYGLLRDNRETWKPTCDMSEICSGFEVVALRVERGAYLEGTTLKESELRKIHGLNVVAVHRQGQMIRNPEAEFQLQAGDVVYVFSEHTDIINKNHLFVGSQAE
jgi:CPA2 family monovalent cation:H+ antiporter-2